MGDFTFGVDDSVPGNIRILGVHLVQGITDQSGLARKVGQLSHLPIGSNLARWNLSHNVVDLGVARHGFSLRRLAEQLGSGLVMLLVCR